MASMTFTAKTIMAIAALVGAACVDTGPFVCEQHADCVRDGVRGFCEADSACSFPDEACPSGFRIAENSAANANQCLAACVVEVAAGAGHTCATREDGSIACWGRNDNGQIGNEDEQDRSSPVAVGTLAGIEEVAGGSAFTCALTSDGEVLCWGDNDVGTLGNGTFEGGAEPDLVIGLPRATAIGAGAGHACAIVERGEVWCWGDNSGGQLGVGAPEVSTEPRAVVLGDGVLVNIESIALGAEHTCGVDGLGVVWCWGDGETGQLGDGYQSGSHFMPIAIEDLTPIQRVTAGEAFTCALGEDGSVWCWGANNVDQSFGVSGLPASAPLPRDALEVEAGAEFACALLDDRSVWCWGDNSYLQLGSTRTSTEPAQVPLQRDDVVGIAVGATHACARFHDGSLECWGDARNGRLGDGGETSRPLPEVAPDVQSFAIGITHACGLDGAEVRCWGDNESGQLGDASFVSRSSPPAGPVALQEDAVEITAGGHTCARLASGTVKCWGDNDSGQLGVAPSFPSERPIVVPGIPAVAEIAAGAGHTCAREASGVVWCWGDNSAGQLGAPGTAAAPIVVPLALAATSVVAGQFHSCAITSGEVWCWGDNELGQLGDGVFAGNGPVRVVLPANADHLAVGGFHACARLTTGAVWCWGDDDLGQLGDGTAFSKSAMPVEVTLADAVELAAGAYHTCARASDGSVRCWGANGNGQLGNDTRTSRDAPGAAMIAGAIGVWANGDQTCVTLADGARCWGANGYGQLGIGAPVPSATARAVEMTCRM
jgi:alpha-tubulin suppressor-like RCC1 family protein